jgi:hypothetical protein
MKSKKTLFNSNKVRSSGRPLKVLDTGERNSEVGLKRETICPTIDIEKHFDTNSRSLTA